MSRLFPKGFTVSPHVWRDEYLIRPLRIEDAEIDYECYMSSVDYIRRGGFMQPVDGPLDWPHVDQTLRWATVLLGHAEYQLAAGERVECGIFDRCETKEFGCLYVTKSPTDDADAVATFWFRADLQGRLDESFLLHLEAWLPRAFPYSPRFAFPGRRIPWAEWPPSIQRKDTHQ